MPGDSRGPYRNAVAPERRPAFEPLYTAGSLHEAQLLLDSLHDAGVEALIVNQHLSGGFGELPYSESLPRVLLLNAEQRSVAADVVRAFEARMREATDAVVTCPSCREENPANFELCWSCSSEL